MTICVFVGPTLPPDDIEPSPEIICLPPVAQGDVLRAVRRFAPKAIGIVDGLFGGAPAVWHKEILWALGEGVAVFGSASMGALRAAELHRFGMQGVGRIFEAYRDGVVEDDDEVAMIHGPAELGYPPLSEPMVNIRATLARAEAEGVLDPTVRRTLEASAKTMHFPERGWAALLDRARADEAREARGDFETWLPGGRVDQKRADALAMLAAMRGPAAAVVPGASFRFAATHHWDGLVARTLATDETDEAAARVLDELRLGPQPRLRTMMTLALLRTTVLGHGASRPESREGVADGLRARRELYTSAALDAWLKANDLTHDAFRTLAARSEAVDAAARGQDGRLSASLLDELRLNGDYPELAARARDKAAVLARESPGATRAPLPGERMALRQGFAARRLDGDADLQAILDATGFADAEALDRALRREHLYLTLARPDPEH